MSGFSFLSHLRCSRCERLYDCSTLFQLCECGAPLLAQYDLAACRDVLTKQILATRPQTLWRYHELLPVNNPDSIVTLGEVMTPLIPLRERARAMDMTSLIIKDEGMLPSGTFKARGAAVGISKAKEFGVASIALPTNGNAGAAWALYAARAQMQATVVMPTSAPLTPRKECVIAGADLYVVDGTIADAGQIISRSTKANGWYDVSTLKEPYRLEGNKTIGFEIAEQFNWNPPDVIIYPTGGGEGVIGIYKAFRELQEMGWIEDRLPRMAIIQSAGCAPLVKAFEQGSKTSELWDDPHTVAFGMRVPKALGDFLILDILEQTNGIAISVTDEEIIQERMGTVMQEGLHVCPEGAAALAGARKLRASGWIDQQETVLVMNTGSGLKYVDQIISSGQPIKVDEMIGAFNSSFGAAGQGRVI